MGEIVIKGGKNGSEFKNLEFITKFKNISVFSRFYS